MVNIENVSSVVRWYESQQHLEDNKPYLAVCSIFRLSPKIVFVYGMLGKLTKAMMVEFFTKLQEDGVEQIIAERKGKIVYKSVDSLLNRAVK